MAQYDAHGNEIPDPTPVAVPAGWQRPVPLQVQIQQMIRSEMSRQAADEGLETFDEADDFDVEDEEPDPLSQYELPMASPDGPTRHETEDGGTEPPPPPEKSPVEAPGASQGHSGSGASSTDSGTVKPPAGGSSRS